MNINEWQDTKQLGYNKNTGLTTLDEGKSTKNQALELNLKSVLEGNGDLVILNTLLHGLVDWKLVRVDNLLKFRTYLRSKKLISLDCVHIVDKSVIHLYREQKNILSYDGIAKVTFNSKKIRRQLTITKILLGK